MRYCHIAFSLAVIIGVLAALPLAAQSPLQMGDVIVVAGRCLRGQCADEILASRFEINVVPAEDTFPRTVYTDFATPRDTSFRVKPSVLHAFAPDRIYFVGAAVGDKFNEILLSADFHGAFGIAFTRDSVRQLVPMASGHLLALLANGDVTEIASDGHVIATHGHNVISDRAAVLALDQCTLLYAPGLRNDARIARYNICTKSVEPIFATLPTVVSALRVLPTGELLVATYDDVYRLNAAGDIVHRYGLGAIDLLALTPDGRTFWAVPPFSNQLIRLPLWDADGHMTMKAANESIANIAVVGEWRPPVPMRRRAARR